MIFGLVYVIILWICFVRFGDKLPGRWIIHADILAQNWISATGLYEYI
jgi:hypothetical protein